MFVPEIVTERFPAYILLLEETNSESGQVATVVRQPRHLGSRKAPNMADVR